MEKLFTEHNIGKWLTLLICRELLKINNRKTNYLIEKWTKKMNRQSPERIIHMAYKHEKEHNLTYN